MKKAEADIIAKEIFTEYAKRSKKVMARLLKENQLQPGLDGDPHPELKAIDDECRRKIQELAAQIDDIP